MLEGGASSRLVEVQLQSLEEATGTGVYERIAESYRYIVLWYCMCMQTITIAGSG